MPALLPPGALDPQIADMRRHERVPLALFGRFSLADGIERALVTRDVSQGGVAFESAAPASAGEPVTLHLEGIGELAGEIVRSFDGGFAVSLRITPERQAELAAQIARIYEGSALSLIEAPFDDPESLLGAPVRLDGALTRGGGQIEGETTARLNVGPGGAPELEFHCAPGGSK